MVAPMGPRGSGSRAAGSPGRLRSAPASLPAMADLRVRALRSIDPAHAPLPHGTEVVTRAVCRLPDRELAMGAVGRVARALGERVWVDVVGVGVVELAREDVLPRKIGQARYAARRASAWEALAGTIVLKTTVGSRAWGLAEEGSDTDERGVFVLPLAWTAGLAERPADLVSLDGSATYWEVDKAVRQALRADPNTLEALFVPGARATDALGEWLLAEREAFVSRDVYGSFARYAVSQLRRLDQSARLARHRELVLAWLRQDPAATLDAIAARLADEAIDASTARPAAILRAKDYVKQLYRSLHDQALLPACDFASLVAFAQRSEGSFEPPRELRPKNAYNLLRLLYLAQDWLVLGEPCFEASGARRARLLAIKRGEVSLSEVLEEAESLLPGLEEARHRTRLPPHPDVARADRLLVRVRLEVARRSVASEPGPWGRDAPPPPEAAWEPEP